MAKKPTPTRKGIPIKGKWRLNPKTGILERVKPNLSPPAKYASQNKRTYKAAGKGSQRP